MNDKCIKSIIVSLLLFGNVAGYAATDQAPVEPEILDVTEMYFAALSSGDRQTLLSLLAEDELRGVEDQLRDPAYSQLLVNRYGTARLEVVDSGVQDELYTVDIIIWMNDIESIKERLILRVIDSPDGPSYRIVSREAFAY
jgi:hypothetical protein